MEGDVTWFRYPHGIEGISIHSLRMEGDKWKKSIKYFMLYFNPLPPYGGRLPDLLPEPHGTRHFNPLPPYGGRRDVYGDLGQEYQFQSTPSVWRETHPPWYIPFRCRYFNPLPPYGGRLFISSRRYFGSSFQSTPSVWRETIYSLEWFDMLDISIHSLRMEGDENCHGMRFWILYFNPLPPYGGRRLSRIALQPKYAFQSTPSVWRETTQRYFETLEGANFNPLPPYGGRPLLFLPVFCAICNFNPLPPYGGRLETSETI